MASFPVSSPFVYICSLSQELSRTKSSKEASTPPPSVDRLIAQLQDDKAKLDARNSTLEADLLQRNKERDAAVALATQRATSLEKVMTVCKARGAPPVLTKRADASRSWPRSCSGRHARKITSRNMQSTP